MEETWWCVQIGKEKNWVVSFGTWGSVWDTFNKEGSDEWYVVRRATPEEINTLQKI